jgi:hypothetical protein
MDKMDNLTKRAFLSKIYQNQLERVQVDITRTALVLQTMHSLEWWQSRTEGIAQKNLQEDRFLELLKQEQLLLKELSTESE